MGFKLFGKKSVAPEPKADEDSISEREPSQKVVDMDEEKNPKFKKVIIGDMKIGPIDQEMK